MQNKLRELLNNNPHAVKTLDLKNGAVVGKFKKGEIKELSINTLENMGASCGYVPHIVMLPADSTLNVGELNEKFVQALSEVLENFRPVKAEKLPKAQKAPKAEKVEDHSMILPETNTSVLPEMVLPTEAAPVETQAAPADSISINIAE
ncbi:MAG: hypothetical protein WC136_03640 [Sphaerochaeta sp.]|jgi:hypothetical protein